MVDDEQFHAAGEVQPEPGSAVRPNAETTGQLTCVAATVHSRRPAAAALSLVKQARKSVYGGNELILVVLHRFEQLVRGPAFVQ